MSVIQTIISAAQNLRGWELESATGGGRYTLPLGLGGGQFGWLLKHQAEDLPQYQDFDCHVNSPWFMY